MFGARKKDLQEGIHKNKKSFCLEQDIVEVKNMKYDDCVINVYFISIMIIFNLFHCIRRKKRKQKHVLYCLNKRKTK